MDLTPERTPDGVRAGLPKGLPRGVPAGFEMLHAAHSAVLMRADVRPWLEELLWQVGEGNVGDPTIGVGGGRGGACVVDLGGRRVLVRQCLRGGLPARFYREVYFGLRPRPFRELAVTETLRRRGAPVAEVYAAKVQWVMPACYRGWVITRFVEGARTLWQWASDGGPAGERDAVLAAVGRAIRRLHDHGGSHPDLNLNNILLSETGQGSPVPEVLLIDFDRARAPRTGSRSPASGGAEIARLRRSAAKLDGERRYLSPADLDAIEAAYRGGEE